MAGRIKKGGLIVNEHTLTASQTRDHVNVLSRWFDFIHHDDLRDRLTRPTARPFCLLTFDDGKRSNASETVPELERLGVPAVFYVTTRFLTDGAPLWFDRYAALTQTLGRTPAGLEAETVKQLPFAVLNQRLDEACGKHGVTPDTTNDDIRPMSWDDARELARRGFTIGAHSLKHAILTHEPEAAALSDIAQSIAEVTSELGTQCTTFAFPNGNYTARLTQHAITCGVHTVMTTEPMWADARFPLWRLPRVELMPGSNPSRITLKLALAATGGLLANPDGTGRLYRKINRLPSSRCSASPPSRTSR